MNERLKYTLEKHGSIILDGWSPPWQWHVVQEAHESGEVTMTEGCGNDAQYTYIVVQKTEARASEQQSADQETRDGHDNSGQIAFE